MTSGLPTVSVIMANYNGGAHLAEAIRSVQRQSLPDLELIVSDDASVDDSRKIVAELMRQDPRVRLVRSEYNGGPAAARNRALTVAKSEWIAIMDSDDLIHPGRLMRLVEAARRDGADIVADDLIEFGADNSRQPPRRLLSGHWANEPFWVDVADYIRLNHFYRAGPALGYLKPLFRASLLKQTRYDETLKIAEDYHLILRLLHSGKTMRVYPFPLYFYRRHHDSISHRLNENALNALLAADLQFLDQISGSEPRIATAMKAKMRSTETALAFERLLNALKAGNWSTAVAITVARPQAAALLRLPLSVRLRRFFSP